MPILVMVDGSFYLIFNDNFIIVQIVDECSLHTNVLSLLSIVEGFFSKFILLPLVLLHVNHLLLTDCISMVCSQQQISITLPVDYLSNA